MRILLNQVKPIYMSAEEMKKSDIYLQNDILFKKGKKYHIHSKSGRGKTSILNFIYGSSNKFEGKIELDNINLQRHELWQTRLSYVYQDLKLFPDLTAFENIKIKNDLTSYNSEEDINRLLDKVGLTHKKNSLVGNLSMGQKQRIACLRALCQPFDFLLMDEPFSHLDKENTLTLFEIINQEIQERQAGLIVTSLGESYMFEFDTVLEV
jgi:putative ABC transport system ATP-binding protein